MNHPDSNNQSDDHLAGPTTLSDRVKSLQLSKYLAEAPKPRNPKLPWFLCLLFAALSALLGWKLANVEEAPSREKAEEEIPAIVPRSSRVVLEAGGFIVPVHRVEVSPKVGGEVIELYIEEGQEVKKHQKLARLDPTKFEFEYRQAKALVDQAKAELEKLENGSREEEIRQAKAALNEAIAQRDQLQDELLRIRQSRAAVPREELVRIESRLRQAQYKVKQLTEAYRLVEIGPRPEEIAKARAAYEHALAQMEAAKYDLENTTVLAPISGRILTKKAEVGDTVRPEAFSNGLSASLCEMADVSQLEVDVDVAERDLLRVFKGQKCEIRTEAFPDQIDTGTVSRVMPEADRSKASVSVRVRIDMPTKVELIRPGMRARVAFLSKDAATKTKHGSSASSPTVGR